MSNVITRNFDSVFNLDSSKLSRLLNIIEERFGELSETIIPLFEISTKKGKSYTTANIDDILDHDNLVNNPIVNLTISYKDKAEEPENTCYVEYDKEDSEIKVRVQASDAKKGNELFAEIEEQIERSLMKNWVYSIKNQTPHELMIYVMLFLMLPMMFGLIFQVIPVEEQRKKDGLTSGDIAYLADIAKTVDSDEKKIEFIFEYQLRKIQNLTSSESFFSSLTKENLLNIKLLLSVLPFIIVIGGIYYIISKTYIGSVFLWGDFTDYYNSLSEKRKFLWNAVIVALIVGVISNLFVFGFSQYL